MKHLITALSLSLLCTIGANGGTIIQVFDSTLLADSASWSSLGAQSSTPVSGTVTSSDGVSVTPTPPSGGSLYRLDQGNGWGGAFPDGDQLLYSGTAFDAIAGDITVTFGELVSGAGLLFQDNFLFQTDTVHLSAYDSLRALSWVP
jgi:hypothetical protein